MKEINKLKNYYIDVEKKLLIEEVSLKNIFDSQLMCFKTNKITEYAKNNNVGYYDLKKQINKQTSGTALFFIFLLLLTGFAYPFLTLFFFSLIFTSIFYFFISSYYWANNNLLYDITFDNRLTLTFLFKNNEEFLLFERTLKSVNYDDCEDYSYLYLKEKDRDDKYKIKKFCFKLLFLLSIPSIVVSVLFFMDWLNYSDMSWTGGIYVNPFVFEYLIKPLMELVDFFRDILNSYW